MRRLCKASLLLINAGYFAPFLTISHIRLVPANDGTYCLPKVVICSSCLFPSDICSLGKSLQALWRIHPDFIRSIPVGEKTVVFTLGTIFYQILARRMPYHKPEFLVVTEKQLRPITNKPTMLESLILDMLHHDIERRPYLDSVCNVLSSSEALGEIDRIIAERTVAEEQEPLQPNISPSYSPFRPRSFVVLLRILRLLREIGLGHTLAFLGFRKSVEGVPKLPIREIGERVATALKDLGPIFIKFGQILSTRTDQFPEEFCRALSTLQDENEPAVPFSEINKILLDTWKVESVDEVCIEISEDPIAVASIGQVHRARLKGGQEVVVKVLKPGIEELVDRDIDLLHWIANRLDASFAILRPFRIPELIEQFERALRSELVFETERMNLLEMEENLSNFPFVTIPTVFEGLSSDKVLVMGFLKGGICVDNRRALQRAGADLELIASRIIEVFLKMFFVDGVFHADPHPGNLFVMSNNKIGLIDFGMIGRIPTRRKFELLYVLLGIINNSPARITQGFKLMGAIPPDQDTVLFEQDISALLARIRVLRVQQKGPVGLGIFLSRIVKIIQQYNFAIPADVYMVFKTMLIVESSVIGLVPDLDLLTLVEEKIKSVFLDKVEDSFDLKFTKMLEKYTANFFVDTILIYRRLGESLVRLNQPRPSPRNEASLTAKKIRRLLPGTVLIFGGLALSLVSNAGPGGTSLFFSKTGLLVVCSGILVSVIGLFKK